MFETPFEFSGSEPCCLGIKDRRGQARQDQLDCTSAAMAWKNQRRHDRFRSM
jgi:hypothetical protein